MEMQRELGNPGAELQEVPLCTWSPRQGLVPDAPGGYLLGGRETLLSKVTGLSQSRGAVPAVGRMPLS